MWREVWGSVGVWGEVRKDVGGVNCHEEVQNYGKILFIHNIVEND